MFSQSKTNNKANALNRPEIRKKKQYTYITFYVNDLWQKKQATRGINMDLYKKNMPKSNRTIKLLNVNQIEFYTRSKNSQHN